MNDTDYLFRLVEGDQAKEMIKHIAHILNYLNEVGDDSDRVDYGINILISTIMHIIFQFSHTAYQDEVFIKNLCDTLKNTLNENRKQLGWITKD